MHWPSYLLPHRHHPRDWQSGIRIPPSLIHPPTRFTSRHNHRRLQSWHCAHPLTLPCFFALHCRYQTCGWAVPFYAFQSHRSQLIDWAAKKERADRICGGDASNPSEKGMMAWWRTRNAESLDGLPALALAQTSSPPPKVLLQSPTQTQTGLLSGYALAFMLGVVVASLVPIHAAKNLLLWNIQFPSLMIPLISMLCIYILHSSSVYAVLAPFK